MSRKNEYDTDRDLRDRNSEAQIELTLSHGDKVRAETFLLRAKTSAYWVVCALLGSVATKVWFI